MSRASLPYRIEWRPSHWAIAGAALIGLLAALAIWLSDLPPSLRPWLALLACAVGLHAAWREARRPPWVLYWPGTDATAQRRIGEDVEPITIRSLHLRGPFAGVSLNDAHGRRVHAVWWPDTLSPTSRRALALCARALRVQETPPA